MSLRSELKVLSAAELIEGLSVRIYEPPLSRARDRPPDIAEPLRVPILVFDSWLLSPLTTALHGFHQRRSGM